MIIVAWKGHLGYYASGHPDQSSLMSFRISIRCTAVATMTDQTARMHKTVKYFDFVVHLWYMDPGETKKGGKTDCCCVPILLTTFPPEPQRNVSIAAVRGAVCPSKGKTE